jgi:hypothetical protein
MADTGWLRKFEDPIPLPDGRKVITSRDATDYITNCRKKNPTCRAGKLQSRR